MLLFVRDDFLECFLQSLDTIPLVLDNVKTDVLYTFVDAFRFNDENGEDLGRDLSKELRANIVAKRTRKKVSFYYTGAGNRGPRTEDLFAGKHLTIFMGKFETRGHRPLNQTNN